MSEEAAWVVGVILIGAALRFVAQLIGWMFSAVADLPRMTF